MNQLLKLKFFVLLSMLYFGGTTNSFGQTKWADWSFTPAGYNFMTSTPTPPSFNGSFSGPGVTSISNAVSSNITVISNVGGGYQIPICGTVNTATSPYFEFTVNHNASSINFSRLVLGGIRLNVGTQAYDVELRWSVNSYATVLGNKALPNEVNNFSLVSYDLSSQSAVTTGTSVSFRLYFKNIVGNPLFVNFSNAFNQNWDATPSTFTA
ncbi:MAG: hypothetical protein ACK49O_06170, partial [Bacteroidota bacterium]